MAQIPTFPSIDFTKLDISKLDITKLDISKFDLSKFDLSKFGVPGVDADKVRGLVRDAAYVVIGFGVLTVQQVQVRRRELIKSLSERPGAKQLGITKEQIDELVRSVEARVAEMDQRLVKLEDKFDAAIESVVDVVGDRLPGQAGALLGQAHDVAKAARKQVRGLITNAA
jgi:hypothetical protein